MSFKAFGEVVEEETPEFKEFGEVAEEKPSRLKSLGRAALRGLTRGAKEFAEVSPLPVRGPVSLEFAEEKIREAIGEPEEKFAEKAVERGIPLIPYAFGGPGSIAGKVARPALAAVLGQSAEELGAGPLAQTLVEAAAFGAPGFRKKIVPTPAQEKGVEMLRRRGLKEKEIAPLMPSKRKQALFSKLGARYGRTEKAAKRTKDALGDVYYQLSQEGKDLPILSSQRTSTLQRELNDKLADLPSSVRNVIQSDMEELFRKPVKGNDLINLWQDINSNIKWNNIPSKNKRLNSLKQPLFNAMEEINPNFAADFEVTNEFYSKFKNMAQSLKPKDLDRLIAVGEFASALGGMIKFGPKALGAVVAPEVGRRVISEMMINPRLQNLTRQMMKAAKNNQISLAKQIDKAIKKELKKQDIDLSQASKQENSEASQ